MALEIEVLKFSNEASFEVFFILKRINGNRRIWHRIGQKISDRFNAFRFRDRSLKDRLGLTLRAIKAARKIHGKIDLIVLDGGADLASDVNKIDEANEAVDMWLSWSTEFDCHITSIIHTNESDYSGDDPRGHLGKQAVRKCEASFILKKNQHDETTVHTYRNRKAGVSEKQPFIFKRSDAHKMHVSVGKKLDAKVNKERDSLLNTLYAVVQGDVNFSIKYGELAEQICQVYGCKEATARRRIKKLRDLNLVSTDPKNGQLTITSEVSRAITEAKVSAESQASLSQ